MKEKKQLELSWHQSIEEFRPKEWNALLGEADPPFMTWEWFYAMEASASISPDTGWIPFHLAVHEDENLIAAAPLYVKLNSRAEFVFDYFWADIASQLNKEYYPKLVGTCPATPAAGYRFLITEKRDRKIIIGIMLDQIESFCLENGIKSSNVHFAGEETRALLSERGYSTWLHQGFLWENTGFADFNEYLSRFKKNQRRNIRRERMSMEEQGIQVKMVNGEQIPEDYLDHMHRLYERTNDQFGPWAARYLNRDFFYILKDVSKENILFSVAHENGSGNNPLALALLLKNENFLIGRYWGSYAYRDALHFNICYYAPIEYAIEHNIRNFDPGMGSPHKIRRGFKAMPNFSLHRFYDKELHAVFHLNIDKLNRMTEEEINQLNTGLPFKNILS